MRALQELIAHVAGEAAERFARTGTYDPVVTFQLEDSSIHTLLLPWLGKPETKAETLLWVGALLASRGAARYVLSAEAWYVEDEWPDIPADLELHPRRKEGIWYAAASRRGWRLGGMQPIDRDGGEPLLGALLIDANDPNGNAWGGSVFDLLESSMQ